LAVIKNIYKITFIYSPSSASQPQPNIMNLLSKLAVGSVALIAIIYQFIFKQLVFEVLGHGRTAVSISTFDAQCERIDDLGLEACEDMWLHEPTGYLYMACSDSIGRTEWLPAWVSHLPCIPGGWV